jgi:RHS repeat-associated protein
MATLDATGVVLGTTQTGPFGEVLASSTINTVTPANTVSGGTFSYVGQHEKLEESKLVIAPIQMGARVYIPGLGRFLSVDPVQGGTPNPYVYPDDPVNDFDLDGTFSFKKAMRYMSYANPLIAYNGLACGAISAIRGKGFARGYDAGVSASWTAASVVLAGPAVSAAKSVASRGLNLALSKGGVYITITTKWKLYVGQTNNFVRRAAEHARKNKISIHMPRIKIPIPSQAGRDRVEGAVYRLLGGKRAPWLENKVRPPTRRR